MIPEGGMFPLRTPHACKSKMSVLAVVDESHCHGNNTVDGLWEKSHATVVKLTF